VKLLTDRGYEPGEFPKDSARYPASLETAAFFHGKTVKLKYHDLLDVEDQISKPLGYP